MFYKRCDVNNTFFTLLGGILTQDDQVTSAPSAVRVSMRTAVWMVL